MESMSKNFAGLTLESHEEEPAFRTPITAFNASEQSSAGNSDGSIDIFKKIDNMFDSIRKKDNSNVLMTPYRSYSSDGNSPSFDDAVVLGSGGGSSSSAAASTGRGLGHGVFSFGGSFGAATGVDDVLCVGSGIRGSGSSYNNSKNDFFLRSESPDSDAGYGTSFGSVLSPTGKQNSNTTDDSGELILRCLNLGSGENASLETAARIHRNGTAMYDASCTWSGQLPHRNMRGSVLSCKVFLGGVPWDITEAGLFNAFKHFGNIRIEWPGKDNSSPVPKGYLYVIFETEKQVKALLNACTHDFSNGGSWYFKISSRRMRNKEVQVIPWVTSDSNYVRCPSQRLDPQKTVFVGALHGMLTAQGLCTIFNDLFGGVVYAGVDTDKYKYPIGSGRVTFNNNRSFMRAVTAAFIEIRTSKFTKKVQVDPYLEDALCSACGLRQGPYFCRDEACFKYFCRSCWEVNHVELRHHKPLMRNNRTHAGGSNAGFGFGFGHGLGQGGYGHGHNYSYPLSYGGNTPFGIGCHSSRLFNN